MRADSGIPVSFWYKFEISKTYPKTEVGTFPFCHTPLTWQVLE
uniref:Uncharacterized protein n=1 Tax=Meloidogyne enterolobii TaxID=390850 RepID=A0A6V7XC76_MELEN|nr:unnamed protein product [Meloidogyne enterolobii]